MSNSVLMENDEKHKKLVINYDGQEWVLEGPRGKEFTGTGGEQAQLNELALKYIKDPSGKDHLITGIWPDEVVIFTNSPGCVWYWTGMKWIWR